MKRIFQSTIVFSFFLLAACSKNLPDAGGTAAQSVANEWWVTLKFGDA